MNKGQFMIVSIVLISIFFFLIMILINTIDKSSVVLFAKDSPEDFENIKNAISQRNNWVGSYWWNLSWENRTLISITVAPLLNIARVDREVRVINSAGIELDSNVTSENSPCETLFSSAIVGNYSIYWNNPSATTPSYRGNVVSGNAPTYSTIRQETSPKFRFCRHLQSIVPSSGVKIGCAVQDFTNTRINYTVNYASLDFMFSGILS